jgi:hypothetical protein
MPHLSTWLTRTARSCRTTRQAVLVEVRLQCPCQISFLHHCPPGSPAQQSPAAAQQDRAAMVAAKLEGLGHTSFCSNCPPALSPTQGSVCKVKVGDGHQHANKNDCFGRACPQHGVRIVQPSCKHPAKTGQRPPGATSGDQGSMRQAFSMHTRAKLNDTYIVKMMPSQLCRSFVNYITACSQAPTLRLSSTASSRTCFEGRLLWEPRCSSYL